MTWSNCGSIQCQIWYYVERGIKFWLLWLDIYSGALSRHWQKFLAKNSQAGIFLGWTLPLTFLWQNLQIFLLCFKTQKEHITDPFLSQNSLKVIHDSRKIPKMCYFHPVSYLNMSCYFIVVCECSDTCWGWRIGQVRICCCCCCRSPL